MRRVPVIAVLAAILFIISTLTGSRAYGQASLGDPTLKGIDGAEVQIIFEHENEADIPAGLNPETLLRDVVQKVRLAGMRTLDNLQSVGTSGAPVLCVDLKSMEPLRLRLNFTRTFGY